MTPMHASYEELWNDRRPGEVPLDPGFPAFLLHDAKPSQAPSKAARSAKAKPAKRAKRQAKAGAARKRAKR